MVEKLSTAATYGGGGTAVFFGLTAGEWQVVGVLGGLVIGAAGLVVNAIYKHRHYALAEREARK